MTPQAQQCFHKAYELQRRGQLAAAVSWYKKSLALHPSAEAYTFLGWTYSLQGQIEDAILECLKAINTDPDFGNPYNDIGTYLVKLGRHDDAIPWLERATAARRYEHPELAHCNLARVYERKGWLTPAMESYAAAVRLKPDHHAARRGMARVRSYLN